MRLQAGQRVRSVVDATELIVIRCPDGEVDLTCGGAAMVGAEGTAAATAATVSGDGAQLGKRYATDDLELLCVKAGTHPVAAGGVVLGIKAAKPLPASD